MSVRKPRVVRRAFFALCAIALTVSPAVFAQAPTGNASISGYVFDEATGEVVSGATITCLHLDTKQTFSSAATAGDGGYELSNMLFGYYDCAVQTPSGLCLANRVVNIPAGESIEISMVIGPPNPEDTEWWSVDSARQIPGLNQVPDSVCRIFEGAPRKLPRKQVRDVTPGSAPQTASMTSGTGLSAGWLLPALVTAGLVGLAAVVDEDNEDQQDGTGTPF